MTEPLTREQLKALRNADSVVFRWETAAVADVSGHVSHRHTGSITLGKDVQRGDGFGSETLRVEVPTPRVIVSNYGHDLSDDDEDYALEPATSGTWVLLSTRFRPEWQTAVSFLRAGDELAQEWTVDNRNTLLKRARLTSHEVRLRAERPTTDGRRKLLTFLIDACVRDPYSLGDEVRRTAVEVRQP